MLTRWFTTLNEVDLAQTDWEKLVKEASIEYLLPALSSQTRILGLQRQLSAEIRTLLSTTAALNSERNEAILAEGINAATLLNEIGIQPTALKGFAYLITQVYATPASRFLADIDLLIPVRQVHEAKARLRLHGFFENDSDRFVQFRHHLPDVRRTGRVPIELHHRVGIGICDRLLPATEIITQATPLTVDNATFLIPSPTHIVTHLIIHSQLAHPYTDRIFPPLRALVDLLHVQKRFGDQIDWQAISDSFTRQGQYATLALHLKQAQHTLGIETPATPAKLPFLLTLRWYRRLLLNRYPKLRFVDPIYLVMALFSRRLRLVPAIIRQPKAWPHVLRAIMRVEFIRNFLSV